MNPKITVIEERSVEKYPYSENFLDSVIFIYEHREQLERQSGHESRSFYFLYPLDVTTTPKRKNRYIQIKDMGKNVFPPFAFRFESISHLID